MPPSGRYRLRCQLGGGRVLSHSSYPMPAIDLPVRLEGTDARSVRFLVDTGAAISILRDPAVLGLSGLQTRKPAGHQSVQYGSGRRDLAVHTLELGIRGVWMKVPFVLDPDSPFSVLGHFDFLDRFVASFYRNGRRGRVEVVLRDVP